MLKSCADGSGIVIRARMCSQEANHFAYPMTGLQESDVRQLIARCSRGYVAGCNGLPPLTCNAFGPKFRPSSDGTRCIECKDDVWVPIVLLSSAFVIGLILIIRFSVFVRRHPEYVKRSASPVYPPFSEPARTESDPGSRTSPYHLGRHPPSPHRYISTLVIIINHVQTLTIIGEMRLEWPLLAKQIMAALSLQALKIPGASPECVMDESVPTFWLFAYSESGLVLLVLLALFFASARSRTAKTAMSIVLSLVFTTSMRTIAALYMQAWTDLVFGSIGAGIATLQTIFEALAIVYFYQRVRLHRRLNKRKILVETSGNAPSHDPKVLFDGKLSTFWQSSKICDRKIDIKSSVPGHPLGGLLIYTADHGAHSPVAVRVLCRNSSEGRQWHVVKSCVQLEKWVYKKVGVPPSAKACRAERWVVLLSEEEAGKADEARIEILPSEFVLPEEFKGDREWLEAANAELPTRITLLRDGQLIARCDATLGIEAQRPAEMQ